MNIGDVVRLRSGGSLMTVTGSELGAEGENALCAWLDTNDGLQRGKFPVICLVVDQPIKMAQVTAIDA